MSADRNLLFGILALQMDFISRDQLIAGMQAWALDKSKPFGEILSTQKALTPSWPRWPLADPCSFFVALWTRPLCWERSTRT